MDDHWQDQNRCSHRINDNARRSIAEDGIGVKLFFITRELRNDSVLPIELEALI